MRFLYGGREEIAVPLSSWPQEHLAKVIRAGAAVVMSQPGLLCQRQPVDDDSPENGWAAWPVRV